MINGFCFSNWLKTHFLLKIYIQKKKNKLNSEQLGHWDMEEMVRVGRLCWAEQSIADTEEHEKQFQRPPPLELRRVKVYFVTIF